MPQISRKDHIQRTKAKSQDENVCDQITLKEFLIVQFGKSAQKCLQSKHYYACFT